MFILFRVVLDTYLEFGGVWVYISLLVGCYSCIPFMYA